MKAIGKKTIWLFFIAVAMTSCSKDDDNCDLNDEESPCYAGPTGGAAGDKLLLVELKVNGKTVETYQYNSQNLLTAIRFSEVSSGFDLNRDNAGRLIRLDHIVDDNKTLIEEFIYDGAGDKPVLCKIFTEKSKDNPSIIRYSYSRNATTETLIDGDGEELDPSIYTFDDNGNILVADVMVGNGSRSVTESSDYDNKNGIFASYPWWWKMSAVNNAQAVKITVAGQVTDRIYKYTYNDAGYPVKAEVYNRGSDVVVETLEFIYKKAN